MSGFLSGVLDVSNVALKFRLSGKSHTCCAILMPRVAPPLHDCQFFRGYLRAALYSSAALSQFTTFHQASM